MIEQQILPAILLAAEITALFFAVTLAVQLFQAKFGQERLRSWMGGRPLTSALKGIALGFATPFCTFTAIPMLVGLRQARVPAAGYVAFIVAAPVLDPVLFGALAIIAGLKVSFIYAGVTFAAALGLALAAERAGLEAKMTPIHSLLGANSEASCETSCDDQEAADWRGLRAEVPDAARRSASLLIKIGPILVVGIGLSMLIETLVPPEVTERLTSASPTFAIPIAAALGTPLYVSTALFVPIAESLQVTGVGIGAIVALTIAGAGANLPEFVMLSKLARPQVIGVFFGYVFAVAVAGGFVTQALIS